jgi:hypothetical protein
MATGDAAPREVCAGPVGRCGLCGLGWAGWPGEGTRLCEACCRRESRRAVDAGEVVEQVTGLGGDEFFLA